MSSYSVLSPQSDFAGEFRVLRPLAQGGMGAVYVVEQLSTGKQRALKVMHPTLAPDERSRARFADEARIGARIDSDHVVEVVGAGVDDETGMPWLAMELLDGSDLEEFVQERGPLPPGEVLELLEQACHALAAAHRVGIIHRDLKPENLFVARSRSKGGAEWQLKILDFGISRVVEHSRTAATVTNAIGSPLWMAPEQAQPGAKLRPSTDVWALGLIAFYLLTHRTFWLSSNAAEFNLSALLVEVMLQPIPRASERAKELGCQVQLPPRFDEWFERCVARAPKERFADAVAAVAALPAALAEAPSVEEGESPESGPTVSPPTVGLANTLSSESPHSSPTEAPSVEGRQSPDSGPTGPSPTVPLPNGASSVEAYRGPSETPATAVLTPEEKARSLSEAGEASGAKTRPRLAVLAAVGAVGAVALVVLAVAGFVSGPDEPAAPSTRTDEASSSLPAPAASSCPPGMQSIPAGTFTMGSAPGVGDDDEHPAHEVTVAAFCLDRTEVTVGAYADCVRSGGCTAADTDSEECNGARADRRNHPVNCVDWNQATAYCRAAGGRLPTEAEWEYAARGTDGRTYPWGSQAPDHTRLNAFGAETRSRFPNYTPMYSGDDGHAGTAPVGSYPAGASPFGVLDLAGNVWEWVSDEYGPYPGGEGDQTGLRVGRGGSWDDYQPTRVRAASRSRSDPDSRVDYLGFRCARGG